MYWQACLETSGLCLNLFVKSYKDNMLKSSPTWSKWLSRAERCTHWYLGMYNHVFKHVPPTGWSTYGGDLLQVRIQYPTIYQFVTWDTGWDGQPQRRYPLSKLDLTARPLTLTYPTAYPMTFSSELQTSVWPVLCLNKSTLIFSTIAGHLLITCWLSAGLLQALYILQQATPYTLKIHENCNSITFYFMKKLIFWY